MSWRIRHLTSDGEKGFGIASRYACLVCGCVVAARVLAPLRLDEELWWFYALVCGGVLFGPLLRVLPESWHGEASPWQLAVARVVLMVLFGLLTFLHDWRELWAVLRAPKKLLAWRREHRGDSLRLGPYHYLVKAPSVAGPLLLEALRRRQRRAGAQPCTR